MRVLVKFMILVLFFTAACAFAQREKAITLINAAGLEAPLFERVRLFAEQELHVPVLAKEQTDFVETEQFDAAKEAASKLKTDADVALIVLTKIAGSSRHLVVFPADGIAVVNVPPLAIDDSEKFARRVERQVMRAAAFSFGLEPTPDPFCVTRDYRSLEDLDTMGRNFSPPWQGRFANEAKKRGLRSLQASGEKNLPVPATP